MTVENKTEKEAKGANTETMLLAGVALVFLIGAAYMAYSIMTPNEVVLNGLHIRSAGDARQGIKTVLADPVIRIEEHTTALNSTQTSGVAMMGAEVAYALASRGKMVYVYEIVDDGSKIGCDENTSFCSNPQIVISGSGCDCLKVDGRIEIEGGQAFMVNNSVIVRGLIGMALSG
ncbi:hypothetical protein COX86_02240 [Candidatus Micrarchaeota archaeon CG_4_10_14_0_2_um_filter_60_11]|nr:MAG: hypothetical protein AUJ16_02790 [Candidatus Micrarchaeota archaeon CG1_02_60_51]PIN96321.1 MAG: hypothetical protein COU39_01945 [Candidatus Micrarchaeota archaeon CG10_big_fil_rev_8_21_14_0_10_60_32]PIO01944.1 MAG: hypothetical protein COT58_02340 [Candidatus Micrarchaeota archaeon CG09_land_8_20_14_0_10_60_16]PIZ90940.1 MAG: hypothetical protein COX86_02240 [Candidatus Micrarchaeota archaeon CG_4_10_14_0_2_um_filter_60_11]